MSRRAVILDVDTGHDDAVAIMMAGRDPAIELVGITVTAGNQTLPKTLRNTLNVCTALSIDTPVYAGMHGPVLAELETAPLIHGESGLDGPVFASVPRRAELGYAPVFIAETVMSRPARTVTLVATGPLSNIAMALRLEPALASRVGELVWMGGSAGRGNVTPSAEFNAYTDPEAASIIFSSGIPVVMIGLDVTTSVTLTGERLSALSRIPGPASEIFAASMERYRAACLRVIGESPAMHDPCCVAYVSAPGIFALARARVDVELQGRHTRGRTVVDFAAAGGRGHNAAVAVKVDAERFWAMLEAGLRRY